MKREKNENAAEHGAITRLLAARCNNCLLCNYARKRPETAFGKMMVWHGTWCPAWKAQQKVYGDSPAE